MAGHNILLCGAHWSGSYGREVEIEVYLSTPNVYHLCTVMSIESLHHKYYLQRKKLLAYCLIYHEVINSQNHGMKVYHYQMCHLCGVCRVIIIIWSVWKISYLVDIACRVIIIIWRVWKIIYPVDIILNMPCHNNDMKCLGNCLWCGSNMVGHNNCMTCSNYSSCASCKITVTVLHCLHTIYSSLLLHLSPLISVPGPTLVKWITI